MLAKEQSSSIDIDTNIVKYECKACKRKFEEKLILRHIANSKKCNEHYELCTFFKEALWQIKKDMQ